MKIVKKLLMLSKVKLGLIVLVGFGLIGLGFLQYGSAAPGQIYTSGSTSIQNGGTKSYQVRVHPTNAADSVRAVVTYDKSKLQFVSVSGAGSPFSLEFTNSGGNGTVTMERGVLGSTVTGDVLVATINFKAIAGSGTAAISMSGHTLSGGAQHNLTPVNSSVTLTSPAPAPTPAPTPTPTPTPNPTTPNTPPADKPDDGESTDDHSGDGSHDGHDNSEKPTENDKPVVNKPTEGIEIKKKRIELTKAILEIITKHKARVHILFGTDAKQLKVSTQPTRFGTSHNVNLPEKLLIPGTTFYYKVVTENDKGEKVTSNLQSLKTKGYTVRFVLRDKFERPIRNQKVKLFSEPMEGSTDNDGAVVFNDVAPGNHHVEYTQGDQTFKEPVTVNDSHIHTAEDGSQTAEEQTVQAVFMNLEFADSSMSPVIIPATTAATLAVLAIGAFVYIRRRKTAAPQSLPITSMQYDQFQPPYSAQSNENNQDDLVNKISGVNRPNPGSTITPEHKDDRNGE